MHNIQVERKTFASKMESFWQAPAVPESAASFIMVGTRKKFAFFLLQNGINLRAPLFIGVYDITLFIALLL